MAGVALQPQTQELASWARRHGLRQLTAAEAWGITIVPGIEDRDSDRLVASALRLSCVHGVEAVAAPPHGVGIWVFWECGGRTHDAVFVRNL